MIGKVLFRKLAVLDYKNNDLKKSKNLHFSGGVSPWFWPKLISLSVHIRKERPGKRVL